MIAPETNTILSAFAQDVQKGLCSQPKSLQSKYFYDAEGDRLFQKIMDLPEYYLTRCEEEILQTHAVDLAAMLKNQHFDLVELGAGDGLKTRVLLAHFQEEQLQYRYFPVDISRNILDHLEETLQQQWPDLSVFPLEGEYFSALKKMPNSEAKVRKVVLFLGSTIGNMTLADAESFLQQLRAQLAPGDLILVGFDLKKNPDLILAAYNDSAKVTRDFNINLLHRINRELGGNFQPENFQHWPLYQPITGHTKSYLISKIDQEVYIEALHLTVKFAAWEAIDMELSKKYDFTEIEHLATLAGLKVLTYFKDRKEYFTDALFVVE
jgi:dimethylhistidine N-methyltransferase